MLEHVQLEGPPGSRGSSIAGSCPTLALLSILVGVLWALARMLFNSFGNDSSAASNAVDLEVLTEDIDATVEYVAPIHYIWGNY